MKMVRNLSEKYYKKITRKKGPWKVPKSFRKRKRKRAQQHGCEQCKNLRENEKQKFVQYWKNTLQ